MRGGCLSVAKAVRLCVEIGVEEVWVVAFAVEEVFAALVPVWLAYTAKGGWWVEELWVMC